MKLHLGCGKRNFGNEWTHIDGGDFPHLHSHDILKLPIEDEMVSVIYASHVLEYFDRQQARDILYNWKLKLKSGGILRLAVPDFKEMARLYINNDFSLNSFLGPLYGKMLINEREYIYHKTVYDDVSLTNLLLEIGFKTVKRWNWRKVEHGYIDDQSQAYLPKMDKENGILISLNLEAIK